jgi:hypothetical protein
MACFCLNQSFFSTSLIVPTVTASPGPSQILPFPVSTYQNACAVSTLLFIEYDILGLPEEDLPFVPPISHLVHSCIRYLVQECLQLPSLHYRGCEAERILTLASTEKPSSLPYAEGQGSAMESAYCGGKMFTHSLAASSPP